MFVQPIEIKGLARRLGRRTAVGLGIRRERTFRTVALLAIITVCGLFDLAFTCVQLPWGNFAELNVVAAGFLDGPGSLITYKSVLFGVGAAILYQCRRRWQSEVGLWLVMTCHLALMAYWVSYVNTLELCLSDPAVSAPLVAF